MPVTQTCPTCGGTGVQTLGMSFEEAIDLAKLIAADGLFRVRTIESISQYPSSWDLVWVVKGGHTQSGGTIVTFKSPESFTGVDWSRWNPVTHRE